MIRSMEYLNTANTFAREENNITKFSILLISKQWLHLWKLFSIRKQICPCIYMNGLCLQKWTNFGLWRCNCRFAFAICPLRSLHYYFFYAYKYAKHRENQIGDISGMPLENNFSIPVFRHYWLIFTTSLSSHHFNIRAFCWIPNAHWD